MPRFENYSQGETPPVELGDRGFIGVNQRIQPTQLPPGYVSDAVNCRFNRGVCETRLGITLPVWSNKAQSVTGTVTRVSQTATFTTTGAVAHNYYTGQTISINGFNAAQYNGAYQITVLTASTFTYIVTPAGNVVR